MSKDVVANHFDQYAAKWHDRLEKYSFRSRRDVVRAMVQGRRFGVVVDVGCGTGDYAPLFNPAESKYHGIDISEKMVAECRKLYPDYEFSVGDGDNSGLSDNFADLVLSIGVLEYYDEPDAHFTEVSRITKKGGTAIIAVPNGENVAREREQRFIDFMAPAIRLKKTLVPPKKQKKTEGYVKDERIKHKKYNESQMISLGNDYGLEIREARFVNLLLIPHILDRFVRLNPFISERFPSNLMKGAARKYSSILICRYEKR